MPPLARPALDPNTLARFVDPLPIPPVTKSDGTRAKVPLYRITMRETAIKVHRDLPPTRFWTYGGTLPGPTLETRSGQSLYVEWINALPPQHFLPIDHHLHGAESSKPEVRAVVHVHGAKVPPESDGYPEAWYEPGKSATCYYPNQQDAAMLWYHDHAMGINRLNIFAGLLGLFIVRDPHEDALGLPAGPYEIPLVLLDRLFDKDGQVYYPVSRDPAAPWVADFAGNATLINGRLFPYFDVEPRTYRFRLLNGSNSRFYNLELSSKPNMYQIGTDQGLLPRPVPLNLLSIAPGERADVVVDFSERLGQTAELLNGAVPIMQFRVGRRAAKAGVKPLPASLRPVPPIAESEAVTTRLLPLDEYKDRTQTPILMLLNRTHWNMPVTERPVIDTVEIWNLINLTEDTHPIHLHLVRFQILDRRKFDVHTYQTSGRLNYTAPAVKPDPAEAGWKDTVRAYARMVTRIIVRFEGYTGRYVWHCHILEHEDNEMMRPFEVVPQS